MNKLIIYIFFLPLTVLISCEQSKTPMTQEVVQIDPQITNSNSIPLKDSQIVPSEEVCMVNDAYMGTKQLAVNFEGNIYYGCCQMCEARIPEDPTVRVAIDPYSQKQVDKSKAVIAIVGSRGEVAYFENEQNYNQYLDQSKEK